MVNLSELKIANLQSIGIKIYCIVYLIIITVVIYLHKTNIRHTVESRKL